MIKNIYFLLLISLLTFVFPKIKYYCKKQERNKACTREYIPVCGWLEKNVRCNRKPCTLNFGNQCSACSDEKVYYVTQGKCPNN